jgi:hypothetical protein
MDTDKNWGYELTPPCPGLRRQSEATTALSHGLNATNYQPTRCGRKRCRRFALPLQSKLPIRFEASFPCRLFPCLKLPVARGFYFNNRFTTSGACKLIGCPASTIMPFVLMT